MVPQRVPEPDRTWLTVAAYNVGFGHLEDARVLTQAFGKNPDSWTQVRERLPLLAQQRWYARARRGYARGWEPVQYVDRIQRYLRLLEWQPGEAVSRSATVPKPPAPGIARPDAAGARPAPGPAPGGAAPPAAPPPPRARAGPA